MCWQVCLAVYLITAFYKSSSIELCEIRSELLFCVVEMLIYCVEYLTFLEMYQDLIVQTCANAQQCVDMALEEAQVHHFVCKSMAAAAASTTDSLGHDATHVLWGHVQALWVLMVHLWWWWSCCGHSMLLSERWWCNAAATVDIS